MPNTTIFINKCKLRNGHMGFSAMLADEYILTDISLSAVSWCDFSSQHQLKFIQHPHFFLSLVTGLDVTQNISTAESPGR